MPSDLLMSIDSLYCKSKARTTWTPGTGPVRVRKHAWHRGPFGVSLFPCASAGSLSLLFATSFSNQQVTEVLPIAKTSSCGRSCSWWFPPSFSALLYTCLSLQDLSTRRGLFTNTPVSLPLKWYETVPICSRYSLCGAECQADIRLDIPYLCIFMKRAVFRYLHLLPQWRCPPLAMLMPGCDHRKSKDAAFMAGLYVREQGWDKCYGKVFLIVSI